MKTKINKLIEESQQYRSIRLKIGLFSTLLLNMVMVGNVVPAQATEAQVKDAEQSYPVEVNRSLESGSTNEVQSREMSAIAVQPSPAAPPIVEAMPALTDTPLRMEPTPAIQSTGISSPDSGASVSKKASDLIATPTSQPLAQADTPTTEVQPAETSPPKPINNPLLPPPGWRFEFEPYLFVPFKVDGDIFIGRGRQVLFPNRPGEILPNSGFNLNVNARFSDITANLTNLFGASGRVQAWNGDFGIIADGLYVNSKFSSSSDGGVLTLRDRIDIPVPGFELDTQTTIASFSLAGSYRIVTVPLRTVTDPSNPSHYFPAISFEALAGARYASVFQSIDFENGPDFEFFGNKVNPMVGGLVKLLLNDKFAFYFRGDTSGFGSDPIRQYYNLHAGIDWKFSGSFALRLAYRINQIEFVKKGALDGDNGLRLRSEGVQLGVAWQF